MFIEAKSLTKSFLDVAVLRDVSLSIQQGDRIGLLGINGAGKTTLLNLLEGSLAPDAGAIVRAKGLSVGYLRQNDALDTGHTLQQEIDAAFGRVHALRAEMEGCAEKLRAAPGNAALLAEYDRLSARFEAMDGWRLDEKTGRVMNGLGFTGVKRDTRVDTLSGGEKTRFAFALTLLREPQLLMLDEPTNHLDFGMLAWLEGTLASYQGAVLVVSHDRYFLNAVAKDICELERGRLVRYSGGYTSFVRQKADRRKTALRAYEKQQEEIARMEDYVRRNLVRASTTKMAQSRRRALEKMERLEKPPPEGKNIALRFCYDIEPFEKVLLCEGLKVTVGQGDGARTLYRSLDLELLRGEKIALVGLNGVGKSTFLKAVQSLVPHKGAVRWGGNVRLGYFDQELAGLPMEETVLQAVHSQYPAKTEFEIRSALGRMLIEGEAVFKRVRELSGAQRAKVAFAILQMRRANVLLLDEPTNHLDYGAKEVLETALQDFAGTLLVVSHDRYFLQRVPTVILELRSEGFMRTDGSYDVYAAKQGGGQPAARFAQPPPAPSSAGAQKPAPWPEADLAPPQGKRGKAQRALDAQRRTRLSHLEKEMETLEETIRQTHIELSEPANAGDYEKLAALSKTLLQDTARLETVETEWLEMGEK